MPARGTVHPRACGERPCVGWQCDYCDGSSPAPAGNAMLAALQRRLAAVHPRACGERIGSEHNRPTFRRFIPAPAGNALSRSTASNWTPVHPRACGERRGVNLSNVGPTGSSPRLRGTLPRKLSIVWLNTVHPRACGERSLGGRPGRCSPTVHPRACGERLSPRGEEERLNGSSPRLRGTRDQHAPGLQIIRFIPAPAGNASPGAPG